eukprot:148725-Prorocentrum_minimum.AAC.1
MAAPSCSSSSSSVVPSGRCVSASTPGSTAHRSAGGHWGSWCSQSGEFKRREGDFKRREDESTWGSWCSRSGEFKRREGDFKRRG